MGKRNLNKVRMAMYSLILLAALLTFTTVETALGGNLSWVTLLFVCLLILLVINITFLHHYTHVEKGVDASEEFFNFPMNLITALATLLFIYQVAMEVDGSAAQRRNSLIVNLSQYSDKVVVSHWETQPMVYPVLNPFYRSIFGNISGNNGQFLTQDQWESLHPNIPFVAYEGHENEWHFAAKFCQQMVDMIRMYDLQSELPINDPRALSLYMDSGYTGWIIAFRMFLSNPTVRNVWEQYKYRHGNPSMTAWVQYYVLNVVDNDPHYLITHDRQWMHSAQKALQQSSTAHRD